MTFEFHGCSGCAGPNYRWPQRLCHDCHANYQRRWRVKRKASPKDLARAKARMAQRRGQLVPEPCWNCGDPHAQMHHPDYAAPKTVWWLCEVCHGLLHGKVAKVAIDLRKPASWVTKEPSFD